MGLFLFVARKIIIQLLQFIILIGQRLKKELLIIVVVFLFLTLGMHHKEWFSQPLMHLSNLPHSGAYGVGAIHPLVFTLAVYLVLWIPRGIGRLFKRK